MPKCKCKYRNIIMSLSQYQRYCLAKIYSPCPAALLRHHGLVFTHDSYCSYDICRSPSLPMLCVITFIHTVKCHDRFRRWIPCQLEMVDTGVWCLLLWQICLTAMAVLLDNMWIPVSFYGTLHTFWSLHLDVYSTLSPAILIEKAFV